MLKWGRNSQEAYFLKANRLTLKERLTNFDKYACIDDSAPDLSSLDFNEGYFKEMADLHILQDWYFKGKNNTYRDDLLEVHHLGDYVERNLDNKWGIHYLDSFKLLFNNTIIFDKTPSKVDFCFRVNKKVNESLDDFSLSYRLIDIDLVKDNRENFTRFLITYELTTSLGYCSRVQFRPIKLGKPIEDFLKDYSYKLDNIDITNIVLDVSKQMWDTGLEKLYLKDLFSLRLGFYRLCINKVTGKILYIGVTSKMCDRDLDRFQGYCISDFISLDLSKYSVLSDDLSEFSDYCIFCDKEFLDYMEKGTKFLGDLSVQYLKHKLSGLEMKTSTIQEV